MNVIRMDGVSAKGETDRTEPELSLVTPESAGERARQLLAQARSISLEHLKALQDALAEAQALSEAVVQGGDLYTPGLHDFARRLAEDLRWRAGTLQALTERQRIAARAG
jgi:hypothetical protein